MSKWSKFTLDNYLNFKPKTYIDDKINIIKKMRNERREIKPYKNYEIQNTDILKPSVLAKLADTDWVTHQYETSFNKLDFQIKIKWLGNEIYIKTTKPKFDNINKRLDILLGVINYLQNKSKIRNKIKAYLVLSDLKREWPLEKETIGVKSVNGGYTDLLENIIFVWREEEFEKVLFHELIHYFDLDEKDKRLVMPYKIEGPTSYFEFITDFWAIYYHIIYLSLSSHKSIKSLLSYELEFMRNQAFTLWNIFLKNNSISYYKKITKIYQIMVI
jgi:hypothetical protein